MLLDPKSYVLSVFGIRLLVKSALIVILSVLASPPTKFPPRVIFPVTSISVP